MTLTQQNSHDQPTFLNTKPTSYSLRISIQHWQLRDLVLCPFTRDELFVVQQSNVVRFRPSMEETTSIMKNLPFTPVSLAIGCGYVAVGGQGSELSIRELNRNWSVSTHVGGTINNSLHICTHAGQSRLLACNNDQTIKVFSLPDLHKVTTVQLPVAVNHATVSPNGNMMVAVGDSNEVFLFDVRKDSYQHVSTLKGGEDAGFSTCWNQSGNQFAAASQDGRVNVWDVRVSSRRLASLRCTQAPSRIRGAARCVKFSQAGSLDLLAFSEHVNYINVVDARTYQDQQAINLVATHDQHISGLSFSPCGTRLFVGTEQSMREFKVDVLARHRFAHGALA